MSEEKAITKITIPVEHHTEYVGCNNTRHYTWLLDLDGPSAPITYTRAKAKKAAQEHAANCLREYQAMTENSRKLSLPCSTAPTGHRKWALAAATSSSIA